MDKGKNLSDVSGDVSPQTHSVSFELKNNPVTITPMVNSNTRNESNLLLGKLDNPVEDKVNHLVIGLLLSYIHNL